nr:hypothetical protein [Pseudomonadota bacterium]
MDRRSDRRVLWGDLLCAVVLAGIMTFGWSLANWHDLRALRLPDTDDVMRLQQIRDWLGGQRFADLAQHRLGAAPGLAMHWSRLPDLVPGAIIAALTPMLGAYPAELTAVIAWPALLFAAALVLTVRIARTLGGSGIARTAGVVAAVAYPATTVFLPGRIDHHGFQVVLLLLIVRALVVAPTFRQGLIVGVAAAASLVIGMETAPLIAVAGAVMAVAWWRQAGDARLGGFGVGFAGALMAGAVIFHPDAWGYAGCDGFDGTVWRAATIAALAPLSLAVVSSWLTNGGARLGALVTVGAVTACGVAVASPACLAPYGMVDPILAHLWLARVAEAQPLFGVPADIAIGYGGLMAAGIAAATWRWYATRDARWAALLAVQLAAFALTCLQLRGAYA